MTHSVTPFKFERHNVVRVILVLVMILLLPVQMRAQTVLRKDEYAFQCAALYGIYWKISENKNNDSDAKFYKDKFDKLAKIAEKQYIDDGKTEEDANIYMQRHVNDLVSASTKDGNILLGFRKICDEYIAKL